MHQLTQILDQIAAFQKAHPFPANPAELYEPCDYILELGGKRLRPALVWMGAELFSDHPDKMLPAAWAVELFHNFTLMHDDIMDAAPLRRGKATVHTRWNQTSAILSGDVMLIYAYQTLASLEGTTALPQILQIFNKAAIEVCEGQQLDVNFESRDDVSIPEYLHMIELKTAVLLGAALQMGAVGAGASAADAHNLYQFGRLAGVAFQIQDDLLDTYGDPEKFGKQVGGDILQNKKTLLVLKTLEVAPEADRQELLRWMQTDAQHPEEKIRAVRSIFDRNHIFQLISAEKERFQTAAFAYLDAVGVLESRKQVLRKSIEALFIRDK